MSEVAPSGPYELNTERYQPYEPPAERYFRQGYGIDGVYPALDGRGLPVDEGPIVGTVSPEGDLKLFLDKQALERLRYKQQRRMQAAS